MNRDILYRTLNDPAQPAYERRRLYLLALEMLSKEGLRDKVVLDYGCGPSDWGVWMATEGAQVTLLDLSPAAIELGLRRARASGVANRVRGFARDASDLSVFSDEEFDLAFASASLHHTLKYAGALEELVRVLKRGGALVLAETYGNNAVLNTLRRLRARLAGEPEEQGEEVLISEKELAGLETHFRTVAVHPLHLTAMAKRLFRGRFTHLPARVTVGALEKLDALLLRAIPRLGRYCGEAVIIARK